MLDYQIKGINFSKHKTKVALCEWWKCPRGWDGDTKENIIYSENQRSRNYIFYVKFLPSIFRKQKFIVHSKIYLVTIEFS